MEKIKLGLIGCGKQAEKHINSLKKIGQTDLCVADVDYTLSQTLSQKSGATFYDNTDCILNDPTVNAVLICTPTPSHKKLIINALEAGKDVFTEKPLCLQSEEAIEIKKAEERFGKFVLVGYLYRYVPVFEEGYRLLNEYKGNGESSLLGSPLSAFFRIGGRGSHQLWKHRKESGGGAINEMLVHMLDLANWYFGPFKKCEVISNSTKWNPRSIHGKEEYVDAEDFVLVRLINNRETEVFCQADLITSAFSQYVEIQGENGSFMGSIQPETPSFVYLRQAGGGYGNGRNELKYDQRNILNIQMQRFVDMVAKNNVPDRNNVSDTIELMKIIDEIRMH